MSDQDNDRGSVLTEDPAAQDGDNQAEKPEDNSSEQPTDNSGEKSLEEALYPDTKDTEDAGNQGDTSQDNPSGVDDEGKTQPEDESGTKDPEGKAEDKKEDEEYELEAPKESPLTSEQVAEVTALAKEQGLTKEAAQKVLDSQDKAVKSALESFQESQKAELVEKVTQWEKDLPLDKEYGGEEFSKNIELAKRVVQRFGSDSLRKSLSSTGLGSHPELVRCFVKIGKTMSEDTFENPDSVPKQPTSDEDLFYGEGTEEK